MNDQRGKKLEAGGKAVALIGSAVQLVGTVSDIREGGVAVSCQFTLPVIPGQPAPVLGLPSDTEPRKPYGKERKSFLDEAGRKIGLGDEVCCLNLIGSQIVATITDLMEPQAGVIVTGVKRGGQAHTQATSGLVTLAGEFILPLTRVPGKVGDVYQGACLYLEKEETEGEVKELIN